MPLSGFGLVKLLPLHGLLKKEAQMGVLLLNKNLRSGMEAKLLQAALENGLQVDASRLCGKGSMRRIV